MITRVVFAVTAFVVPIGTAWAQTSPDYQLELHRKRLQSMSPSERRRAEASFEKFDALPEAEKEQLRTLHANLKNSGAEKENLEETMMRYLRWRDTLTDQQREELDAAASTQERLQIVNRLVQEQKEQLQSDLEPIQKAQQQASEMSPREFFQGLRTRFFSLVEPKLRPKLSKEEQEWLDNTKNDDETGFRRLLAVGLLLKKYDVDVPDEELSRPHRSGRKLTAKGFADFSVHFLEKAGLYHRFGRIREDRGEREREQIDLALSLLMLKPLDKQALFNHYDSENIDAEKRRYWSHLRRAYPSSLWELAVTKSYYEYNPDKLPPPLREKFKKLAPPDRERRGPPFRKSGPGPKLDKRDSRSRPGRRTRS